MAIKISGSNIIDDNRHIVSAGVITATRAVIGTGATITSGGIDAVGLAITTTTIKVGTAISITDGAIAATRFYGDGTGLSNTGSTLSAASGSQRVVVTSQTTGTMTASSTDADLTFDASTNTLAVGGNLELGHATDTTISRVSAGRIAVEGVNVVTTSSTDTLTNKTLTSPTLTTPALGTPASGTLTNCTGLPISTGVAGLAAGAATFLATPSSANLAAAVTDETGTGALVFATSPTLVTPVLGSATATRVVVGSAVTVTSGGLDVAGVVTATSAKIDKAGIGTAPSGYYALEVAGQTWFTDSNGIWMDQGGFGPKLTFTAAELAQTYDTFTINGTPLVLKGQGNEYINLSYNGAGFGTATPQSKYHFVGDVRYDGNINSSGIVTATTISGTNATITNITNTNLNVTGVSTLTGNVTLAGELRGPANFIIDPAAVGDNTGSVRIKGDLYVDGTQTVINSTALELADLNIGIASAISTNALLDGGGIGIGSVSIRKTITWNNTASSLKSSENWDIATGKTYMVNGTTVLSASQVLGKTIGGTSAGDIVDLGTAQTLTNKTLTSPTLTTPVLGTPSSGTLTNCTGLPISSGVSGLAAGAATFLATPSSANLATLLTDETGSGANVFATSPTLVTPVLGTPSSGTLTNCTGLPISGLTASTSTALGVGTLELGHATDTTLSRSSAGVLAVEGVVVPTVSSTNTLTNKTLTSPTLTTPVLGTPSSGTLTSCTGLPLSTGVTGTLPVANGGTGVTGSTGTGSVVLSTSPSLTTPALGTPSSGTLTNCTFPTLNQNTTGTSGGLTGTPSITVNAVAATSATVGGVNVTTASNTQTLTNKTLTAYAETTYSFGNTGTAPTLALSNGNFVTATLTGNATFTFSMTSVPSGSYSFTLVLSNDGTAGRSITWPASVKWPNATVPTRTTTASRTDVYTFFTYDSGTTWWGNLSLYNFS